MDHAQAALESAVERYLLGELKDPERGAFEEHFFECAECAEEVRLGTRFQANARAALRETGWPAAVPAAGAWQRWWGALGSALGARKLLPAAAMAGCAALALAGYQSFVLIPQLRHGTAGGAVFAVVPAAPVSGVRAAVDLTFSLEKGPFSLFVPHEWDESYGNYRCELERRPGGKVVYAGQMQGGAGDFSVVVQPAGLEAGRYLLNVYGVREDGPKTAVARFPLTLVP